MVPEEARDDDQPDEGFADDYTRVHESAAERLDRNWNELLQELRVTQTGVQILTGFLLAMPLQSRFADINQFERNIYMVALSLGVLATCLLVAPVSLHRVVFRMHRKDMLVRVGARLATTGLAVLALAVTAVTTLIFSVVAGDRIGVVAGTVTLVVFTVAWAALPLGLRGPLQR
jgi:hypothetical protein